MYKDTDPQETKEWLESIEDALEEYGQERTQFLLQSLISYAQAKGARLPFNTNTPYINTIPKSEQLKYPGNLELEESIGSAIRWNAMAMVTRANTARPGTGGHISTYASAATLYEVAFNHFFKGPKHPNGQDLIFFQGHCSPGIYARSFLEGRFTTTHLENFRQELSNEGGLSSYPHPYLMPSFWQFATVSMGLGPIMGIYQARFMRYMIDRGLMDETDRKVFVYTGDGEMDEPESLGALTLASRENLNNLIFVVNCNLQRLDGPVRGNSKVIQELEGAFRGAGWNVIKVIWGSEWDGLFEKDVNGKLLKNLSELVDGDLLKYIVEGGAYFRKEFFGKDPELLKMVSDFSDQELEDMLAGGHDPIKMYSAYHEAINSKDKPTAILARTIKGFGLGDAGEGRNITHNQKKLNDDQLLHYRDRFKVELNDNDAKQASFYQFKKESKEFKYLQNQRELLGGDVPFRSTKANKLSVPDITIFDELLKGTGQREVSTTMAYVRLLTLLTKDKSIGKYIVPIVPDEARTFGMDPLFRQLGIYAHKGQLYEPVDSDQFLYYKEAQNGQILEEGINEAGAMSSFCAAATSYSNHGIKMIPFYIYYSMFGFQRVWDLVWAAGDMRSRGFLLGGTAGRTTLNGEGLQHQDGHSHLAAAASPNIKAYDVAYGYEIATIVHQGLKEMCEQDKDVIYYLTLENENYLHPPIPNDATHGIIKGLYKIKDSKNADARIFGSGPLLNEALAASELLSKDWNIHCEVWNVTSFSELRKNAEEVDRWNTLHPSDKSQKSYLEECIVNSDVPTVAVSDYIKMVGEQISSYIPGPYYALGTDGFGRSDTRENLRHFFEVDRYYITLNVIRALIKNKKLDSSLADTVMSTYEIDPEKPNPIDV
ncbi:MAG: pyruvate dehydrogenase (acetyl-transferring), homodimeric type [Candidatus Neomarinimicrobiota bacterium]|nr:pyruvate dehydrogenase (acetyl-transferring), homodimeric type [Candidatus Neomarinimicrobiota bacterium]